MAADHQDGSPDNYSPVPSPSVRAPRNLDYLDNMVGECYIAFERLMDDVNQEEIQTVFNQGFFKME